MTNNLDTPSSELQINFGALQIDTKNSATGNGTLNLFLYGKKEFDEGINYDNASEYCDYVF